MYYPAKVNSKYLHLILKKNQKKICKIATNNKLKYVTYFNKKTENSLLKILNELKKWTHNSKIKLKSVLKNSVSIDKLNKKKIAVLVNIHSKLTNKISQSLL